MSTNHDNFESLAQAAIEGEATDLQLEALESVIMESDDGAERLRELAEANFTSAHISEARNSQSSVSRSRVAVATASRVRRRFMLAMTVIGSVGAAAVLVATIAGVLMSTAKDTEKPAPTAAKPDHMIKTNHVFFEDNAEDAMADETMLSSSVTVPEPTMAALLLSGSFIFVLRRRRPFDHRGEV